MSHVLFNRTQALLEHPVFNQMARTCNSQTSFNLQQPIELPHLLFPFILLLMKASSYLDMDDEIWQDIGLDNDGMHLPSWLSDEATSLVFIYSLN
ncbi:hypothetical protein BDR04DRAFT_1164511 [Suillus decipiens]|nr:hypothetical protein BDR04DRAFT_1164511 [Suillus decipiens]